MLKPSKCAAFTLIELLVVIAIIGSLISILLPAVNAARGATQRTVCQNNLRQIGIALLTYHATNDSYPVGCTEWRARGDVEKRQLAWSAFLLPFIEQQSLHDSLDFTSAFDSPQNAAGAATMLSVYMCPSSRRGEKLIQDRGQSRGPCDYGGIFGERISSPNQPPKGTMLQDIAISQSHITDGVSNTLLVGEDSRSTDGQWINGRNIFDQAFPINAAPKWENDIRSEHRGGAHGVRADGSVHFMSESIAPLVLAALCTRDGNEVVSD